MMLLAEPQSSCHGDRDIRVGECQWPGPGHLGHCQWQEAREIVPAGGGPGGRAPEWHSTLSLWCTRPATLLAGRVVADASGGPKALGASGPGPGLCLACYAAEKPAFGRTKKNMFRNGSRR
jgi:hypothetical protein